MFSAGRRGLMVRNSGSYSLPVKTRFRDADRRGQGVLFRCRSPGGSRDHEAERLILPMPFGGYIGESCDSNAVREAAIERRLDEIRCEEGE